MGAPSIGPALQKALELVTFDKRIPTTGGDIKEHYKSVVRSKAVERLSLQSDHL